MIIAGGVLLLLLASGLQLRQGNAALPGKGRHLAKVLPLNLVGWTGRDVPLGATEAVQGAVEKTLQFEDVYFREFTTARGVVSLYVAYWGPGEMPTQLVASHTPDRCWTSAGWVCESRRHQTELNGTGVTLRAGEWRLFSAPNAQRLNVHFWHLVGTETYDYGDRLNKVPSAWRWWRDAAKQVFKAPPEQYFIRLTSEQTFEELKGDPGWEELVESLAKLGLDSKGQGAKR
jgi:hypothetical protein